MNTREDLAEQLTLRESRPAPPPEGGLPDLLEALRWRWKSTLLIALLFTAGATTYVESLPSEYDGKALVAIGPRRNVPTAGADTVRVIGPKYVEYATAPSTLEELAPTIDEDVDVLEDAVDANIAVDTGNLDLTVRLPTPERAADAANALARQVVEFSQSDPLLIGQIVTTAIPSDTPAAPPRRLLEAAALVAGLLLGVAVSLLLERGRPRLRNWRSLAALTGYPVVGRIPSSRTLRLRPSKAFADPRTASAFRILRANLEPQLREGAVDLIVVTSPGQAEGKTTVAALLSESLGRLGLKVLLMDADLRRPGLAHVARLEAKPGLAGVLRNGTGLNGVITPGWAENLWLLPTVHDPDAGDLLARRFSGVLDDAHGLFDVIVVDAPPLLGTDDARTLATMAKGILLVVSAGTTTSALNEAVLAVEALNAPLMGIVGNRFKESSSASYYYSS